MAVLDSKPKDADDRGLCGLALVLWPGTITLGILFLILYCFVEGINQLVKSAVNPSDTVARVAAKAWRIPARLALPARIHYAEVRDRRKEQRQAEKEVDELLDRP